MKKENKSFFIIFMTVWILLVVLNFIIPTKSFSEQENRYMAKFPKFTFENLVSGKYSEELNDYINDYFVFRNAWLKTKSFTELALGKKENNGVYIGKDGFLFEKFEFGEEELKNVKSTLKSMNNLTNKIDIPIYFALVPNSIYINSDKLPDNVEVDNQEEIIDKIYENTQNTINIDTVDILKENKENYIYFKTDHHFTSDGAYLVYLKFCEKANISPVTLENYERKCISEEFLGTFDSKAQIPNQEKDKIYVYMNDNNRTVKSAIYDNKETNKIYNEEYLSKKDKYSYFLNGNNSKVTIKTNIQNGKKLLLIKDSYSHIMAQFLCQNFEELHFIDPRYYTGNLNDYIEENNITDILFLYNVSTFVEDKGIVSLENN